MVQAKQQKFSEVKKLAEGAPEAADQLKQAQQAIPEQGCLSEGAAAEPRPEEAKEEHKKEATPEREAKIRGMHPLQYFRRVKFD